VELPAGGAKVAVGLTGSGVVDLDGIHPLSIALEDRTQNPPLRIGRDPKLRAFTDARWPLVSNRAYTLICREEGTRVDASALESELATLKKEIVGLNEKITQWEERKRIKDKKRKKKASRTKEKGGSTNTKARTPEAEREEVERQIHAAAREKEDEREKLRDEGMRYRRIHREEFAPLSRSKDELRGSTPRGNFSVIARGQEEEEGTRDFFEEKGSEVLEINVGGQYFITLR